MKQISTADLRLKTISYWAGFSHARAEADVARVHAFQALVRDNPDLTVVTDDQVSEAYGGRGWAPVPVCIECGAREDTNVMFGPDEVPICQTCIAAAAALNTAEAPPGPATKRNLFSRFFGA